MIETLTILHTNDLHGHYDMALRQSAFLKKRKQKLESGKENVLLLDGGDHFDMSMNECLATSGYIHLDMLEATGYDAMSVGNNELLRLPKDKIRSLSKESKVPWLLMNLLDEDGGQIGGTKEFMILEKGKQLKVGLFGATDQFEDIYVNKHNFKNRDTSKVMSETIDRLKNEGANLIIFLSHLGYEEDLRIAEQFSNKIDVIIGAHSHTVLEKPEVVSGVIVAQAGYYGNFVGELNLTIDVDQQKVVNHQGKLTGIKMEDEIDPELDEVLKKGRLQAKAFLSEVVYYSESMITHEKLVKMGADSLKKFWRSDIGIMYGGGMTDGLKSGEITKGDVLDVCKSMHTPVLIEMTGKQIKGLIEETYKEEITKKKIYGGGFRPQGIEIGKLQFSGVDWKEENGQVFDVLLNGEPISLERTYTIGSGTPLLYEDVCGYQNVIGNEMLDIGKDIMVKDVLIDYMKQTVKTIV